MDRHKAVKKSDDNLKIDWQKDLTFTDDCFAYCNRFLSICEQFESMLDEKIDWIKAVQHRIELNKKDGRPIHSAPYRFDKKAREFEKPETDRMLSMDVIESGQTEWTLLIVLVPKKDGIIRFCVDYRKLNAVMTCNSCPIPCMDKCIDLLDETTIL